MVWQFDIPGRLSMWQFDIPGHLNIWQFDIPGRLSMWKLDIPGFLSMCQCGNSIIRVVLVRYNSIIRNVLLRVIWIIRDILVGTLVVLVICRNENLDSSLHIVAIAIFAPASTPTVGPIQPLSQWLPGVSSSVMKLPKWNACHTAEVCNTWSFTSPPPNKSSCSGSALRISTTVHP